MIEDGSTACCEIAEERRDGGRIGVAIDQCGSQLLDLRPYPLQRRQQRARPRSSSASSQLQVSHRMQDRILELPLFDSQKEGAMGLLSDGRIDRDIGDIERPERLRNANKQGA